MKKQISLWIMLNDEKYFDAGRLVDEVLKKEPDFVLPDSFAESLALKVGRKFVLTQYFKEFLIYLGVIVGIVIVSVAMAFIWHGANLEAWLQFIVSNFSLVAGINILVIFILFADRVLLRYFFYKTSMEIIN